MRRAFRYDNWGLSTHSPILPNQRWKLHVVTLVSCTRLVGAPLFVFLFSSRVETEYLASLPLLVFLFFTDIVDGYLARRWDVATNFGYVLDGVADRSAHIALVMALNTKGLIAPVLALLLVLRDLMLYAARALFDEWWLANAQFRARVRFTAIIFKVTVGGLALLNYLDHLPNSRLHHNLADSTQFILHIATWFFAAWSYVLLAQQIVRYAIAADSTRARVERCSDD